MIKKEKTEIGNKKEKKERERERKKVREKKS